MAGADVHAGAGAQVVIGYLGDHRIGTLDTENVKEGSIALLRDPSDLKSSKNCIAFVNSGSYVPCHLHVEQKWIRVLAHLPTVVV